MSCVVTQPDSLAKVATDPCEVGHPERAAATSIRAYRNTIRDHRKRISQLVTKPPLFTKCRQPLWRFVSAHPRPPKPPM